MIIRKNYNKNITKLFLKTGIFVLAGFLGLFVLTAEKVSAATYEVNFASPIIDNYYYAEYGNISWSENIPADTEVFVKVRSDSNSDMSGATAWASCSAVSNNTDISGNNCVSDNDRYLQYQIILGTNNTSATPTIYDISIENNTSELFSSIFDSEDSQNIINGISWDENLNGTSNAVFQIRTSADGSIWSDWCGPDNGGAGCDTENWFTDPDGAETVDAIFSDQASDRYFQYRAVLLPDALGGTNFPVLDNVNIDYELPDTATRANEISYVGPISNIGTAQEYLTIDWTANVPADTSLSVKVRTDSNADMSGATEWATCNLISNGEDISSNNCVTDGEQYFQYQITLGTDDILKTPTLYNISVSGLEPGELISSPYNSNSAENLIGGVSWTEDATLPDGTKNTIYLRSASSVENLLLASWSEIVSSEAGQSVPSGCTKESGVFSCNASVIPAGMKDGVSDQYFQYKIELSASEGTSSIVSQTNIVYVVNANPEFEAVPTAVPNSTGDVDIDYSVRDPDTETDTVTPSFEYSLDGGSSWTAITEGCLGANDLDPKDIEEVNYTPHEATWTPSCEAGISTTTYETDAQVRVTIDDGQAANDEASSDSINFTLDTKPPVITDFTLDASIDPAEIDIVSTDDSTYQMRIAQDTTSGSADCQTNLTNTEYETYNASPTLDLNNQDPQTICLQLKDQYDNESTVSSLTTPETPQGFMIQDTSNMLLDDPEYRLFIAWQVVADTTPAFLNYEIYRSETENSGYALLETIDVRTLNYYADNTTVVDTDYYYKVKQIDEDNNISFFSTTIHAKANGIEDYGEGGGGTSDAQPVINSDSVNIADIFTTQATITWETDKISDSTVEYITQIGGNFTDAPSQGVASMRQDETVLGIHQVTLNNLTPNTTYYLKLKSTDPYGNTGENQDGVNGYTFTTLDGPNITAVNNRNRTSDSVEIVWTTDIASDSYVTYDDNDSFSSPTTIGSDDEVTSHIVEITGLNPETPYYFYVESDVAKDDNQGNYYTFTTLAEEQEEEPEDEEGPTISNVEVSDITYDSATVSWETDTESDSFVDFSTDQIFGDSRGKFNDSTTIHEVLINGLESVTTYYYRVRSMDVNNNISLDDNSSSGYTFTTLAPTEDTDQDGTGDQLTDIMNQIQEMIDQYFFSAQEIQDALSGLYSISISSSGPSVDVTDNIATISWTTNREAIGKVYYWQESDNQDTARSENENITIATTNHEIILKNLNADTKYSYYVESIGLLNESTTSTTSSFTTEDIPQISGISIENVTLNSADISWSTTDSVDSSVLQYGEDTSYGNEEEGETSSSLHTVNLTNLKTNTTYHLRVSGEDSDGQTITSNDYSFTTVSLPTISDVKVQDITTETALITWSTNVKTDSRVEFKRENQDKGTTQGNLEAVTDHTFTLTNLYPGSKYTFKVSSKDALNNESSSEENSFTTEEDLNPPQITNVKSDTTVFPGKEAQIQTIISWNTDKNATSVLAYREGVQKDPSLDEQLKNKDVQKIENWKLTKKNELTKNHLFVLTDLKPASLYQFKVVSFDKHDNLAISENFSLLTPTKQQSVLDLIIENFETTFGWVKKIGE